MDFAEIDAAVKPLVDQLDHQYLNDLDGFSNPTSEFIARWLYEGLRGTIPVASVTLAETDRSECIYRGES